MFAICEDNSTFVYSSRGRDPLLQSRTVNEVVFKLFYCLQRAAREQCPPLLIAECQIATVVRCYDTVALLSVNKLRRHRKGFLLRPRKWIVSPPAEHDCHTTFNPHAHSLFLFSSKRMNGKWNKNIKLRPHPLFSVPSCFWLLLGLLALPSLKGLM